MNRFRFIKVRKVKSPNRGNLGDAGIDFFIPDDLQIEDLRNANINVPGTKITLFPNCQSSIYVDLDDGDHIEVIHLAPHSRVIIPSGIKGLLEPENSMLQVNNKSGVSTKKGLVFTAEVVDSTYTGEIHLCVANLTSHRVTLKRGDKLVQLIHIPVYLTEPEEVSKEDFQAEASNWSSRGTGWQGSTGNK